MMDPPAFMWGTAALEVRNDYRSANRTYLVMANMARMLLRNVLSTFSSCPVS